MQMRNYSANSAIPTTATLWKNALATSLSCTTLSGGGQSCSDTSAGHAVSLAVNDTISLQLTTTDGGGFAAANNGEYLIQLHCK
jgi:hypothetical protein